MLLYIRVNKAYCKILEGGGRWLRTHILQEADQRADVFLNPKTNNESVCPGRDHKDSC